MASKYVYKLTSDPLGIQLNENLNFRALRKVYFKDSLIKFFPYAELFIKDQTGVYSDLYFFIEGWKLNIQFGSPDQGYFGHDYCWSEGQLNNAVFSDHIGGDHLFIMLSDYYLNDYPLTKGYQGEISTIVQQIVMNEFGIPATRSAIVNGVLTPGLPNIHITNTMNGILETWYQAGRTNREFIEYLATRAYTSAVPQSQTPFVTFINSNGEFYFMTLYELYTQAPIKTFEIKLDDNMLLQDGIVKSYNVYHGGLPTNKENYIKDITTLQEDGTVNTDEVALKDFCLKPKGTSKMMVRTDYLNVNQIQNFGLVETTDINNLKGRYNTSFINSDMSYRMTILDTFDPNLVAGKTISIKVHKANSNGVQSPEYGGNWLIISSEVKMNCEGFPVSQITIAKPSIEVSKDNTFLADFI